MSCFSIRREVGAYLDGRLTGPALEQFLEHIGRCDSCASRLEETGQVCGQVRELPDTTPPRALRTNLRVIASQERQVIEQHRGSRLKAFWEKWSLRIDDLMRPLTVPATGGLLSSFILFALFGFTITTSAQPVGYEVPVLCSDRMDANLVPLELRSAIVVTMALDRTGRIVDYAVRDSSASFGGNGTRLQGNNISMPQFPTVLAFAQPISSDISISVTPLVFRP